MLLSVKYFKTFFKFKYAVKSQFFHVYFPFFFKFFCHLCQKPCIHLVVFSFFCRHSASPVESEAEKVVPIKFGSS